MIRDAIRERGSFNVIYLDTMYKADVFIPKQTPWAGEQMARRRPERFGEGDQAVILSVASAEDMVLQKLEWFRMGGGVSDRQWGDVLGILKVQAGSLDDDYLRRWADEPGLSDLLGKALEEAGIV
jgi:hypothetical protein